LQSDKTGAARTATTNEEGRFAFAALEPGVGYDLEVTDNESWPGQISAITLFVEDLAAAKQFYRDAFGLPVAFEDDNSAVFKFKNTLINLLTTTAARIDPGDAVRSICRRRWLRGRPGETHATRKPGCWRRRPQEADELFASQ